MKQVKLMQGDNILSLKKLPDNSIDSVVTDGPYGLSFMNKKWDYDVPSVELWKEIWRVLKPGGHVLSFGGTRTFHRMVVNIEDAGFEIRDQIMWIYGSGFPKSHNIGKSYDKKMGNEREEWLDDKKTQPNIRGNGDQLMISSSNVEVKDREPIKHSKGLSQWEGWGTAVKPAVEPICVARKPLSEKTIVDNVIRWGVGGINIDGCRVKIDGEDDRSAGIRTGNFGDTELTPGGNGTEPYIPNEEGRFPANIIFDETAAEMLDEQSDSNTSRFFYIPKVSKKERNMGLDLFEDKIIEGRDENQDELNVAYKKRPTPQKNIHATVKPINLMIYLCRLVTPPGGIVLDPFMGSGSTGISACLEGFRFVGMELDEEYFKIAKARINSYEEYRKLLKK